MKYGVIISFIIIAIFVGCEIEEEMNKAADRCEDKISKVLENVEDVCLTKEEILELIHSIKDETDAPDGAICGED
tara:strand:+ start:14399 stop:14623 length:225 start_codon:yes stop_codon:yes gene_type:complete